MFPGAAGCSAPLHERTRCNAVDVPLARGRGRLAEVAAPSWNLCALNWRLMSNDQMTVCGNGACFWLQGSP